MTKLLDSLQVLGYRHSYSIIRGYKDSKIAKTEKNDCLVKAVASALNEVYDEAHKWCKTVLNRSDRKGAALSNLKDSTYRIGQTVATFKKLGPNRTKNVYKLKGQEVLRDKTVKSFIKTNQKGTFIVSVSGHAFTVADGVLIDNIGEEFRPTRKVLAAWKVDVKAAPGLQIELF